MLLNAGSCISCIVTHFIPHVSFVCDVISPDSRRSPATDAARSKRSSFASKHQSTGDSKPGARRSSRAQNNNNSRVRSTSADDANMNNSSKRDLRPDDFEAWGSFNTPAPARPDRSTLAFTSPDPRQRAAVLSRIEQGQSRRHVSHRFLVRQDTGEVTRVNECVTLERHTQEWSRSDLRAKNRAVRKRYSHFVRPNISSSSFNHVTALGTLITFVITSLSLSFVHFHHL